MKNTAALLLIALVGGCSTRVGDLTLVSTKNLGQPYTIVKREVSARDCGHLLFLLPLGSLDLSLQEVADAAIRQGTTGDMLVNVSVYRELLYLLLYNRTCIRVTGDVARSSPSGGAKDGSPRPPPEPLPTPPPRSSGMIEKVE